MSDADLDAAIDRLYAVPPDAFVAERTRLAKELRGAGDRPAAAAACARLYAAPPDAFVAGRTRLAKGLRGAGDRPAAAQVAKLAKPSAAAWALNHVARQDADVVAAWLDAAAALRDASSRPAEGGGGAVPA